MKKSELERLEKLEERIREIAKEEGLYTTDVNFEIVPPHKMFEGAAYEFPGNFSHWVFGRDFDKTRTIYERTMSGIAYEQVWNFKKPRAFILETNPFALKVLTIAHVYGHVDFFLQNRFCQRGREFGDMEEIAISSAERFRKYEEKYGYEVEKLITAAMSIRWHQHPDLFFDEPDEEKVKQRLLERERARMMKRGELDEFKDLPSETITELNERQLKRIREKTPPVPVYDILWYVINKSPQLDKPWMKDVLSTIRAQARALAPNSHTKLLNEGWATYWHTHIMRRLAEDGLITAKEHGVFADFHSGVTAKKMIGFNWYSIGPMVYEYVKEKWDKGRFGREYEECKDLYKKATWDTGAIKGKEKIFEVRSVFSDKMAVETFFTDEFIRNNELYIYEEIPVGDKIIYKVKEDDPKEIRTKLREAFTYRGVPIITVEDGNREDRGWLYLKHHHNGQDLDPIYRDGTLKNIYYLWGKRVMLETVIEDRTAIVSFNGQNIHVDKRKN